MNVIHIPSTADEAVTQLGSLGRLINAKKWERAAIVAALVGPAPGRGRRGKEEISSFPFTTTTLENQGIVGLKSNKTIEHYRDVWCRQRPVPALGEEVDLSDLPEWPGIPEEELAQHTGMTPERRKSLLEAGQAAGMPTGAKVVDVAANPKAMAAAIIADDEVARAAVNALDERHARNPRLGKPPETADGKAARAMLQARNAASLAITDRVLRAVVLLEEVQRDWDTNIDDLAPREREEVRTALVTGEALMATLRMYMEMSPEEAH